MNTVIDSRSERILFAVIKAIRNHPDPARAEFVLFDMMERISAGESPASIEKLYAEDLKFFKGAAH